MCLLFSVNLGPFRDASNEEVVKQVIQETIASAAGAQILPDYVQDIHPDQQRRMPDGACEAFVSLNRGW